MKRTTTTSSSTPKPALGSIKKQQAPSTPLTTSSSSTKKTTTISFENTTTLPRRMSQQQIPTNKNNNNRNALRQVHSSSEYNSSSTTTGATSTDKNNNNKTQKSLRPLESKSFSVSDREAWTKLAINNNETNNISNACVVFSSPLSTTNSQQHLDLNQSSSYSSEKAAAGSSPLRLRLGSVVLYRDQLWRVRYLGPVRFASSSSFSNSSSNAPSTALALTRRRRNTTIIDSDENEEKSNENNNHTVTPRISQTQERIIKKYFSTTDDDKTNNNNNNENNDSNNGLLINLAMQFSLYIGLELLQPRDEDPIEGNKLFPTAKTNNSSSSKLIIIDDESSCSSSSMKSPILVGSSSHDGTEYFTCSKGSFVVIAPFHEVLLPASSFHHHDQTTTTIAGSTSNADDQQKQQQQVTDEEEGAKEEESEKKMKSMMKGFVVRKKKEMDISAAAAAKSSVIAVENPEATTPSPKSGSLSSSTPTSLTTVTTNSNIHNNNTYNVSAFVSAKAAVQRLVDLMERRSTHEGELLQDILDNVVKPPLKPSSSTALLVKDDKATRRSDRNGNKDSDQTHHQTTNKTTFLQQIEDAIKLAQEFTSRTASTSTTTSTSSTADRLHTWKSKVLNLESSITNETDDFRAKIGEVPDTILEIARRLSFDAEDLIRSKEEAAREHGDVEALQTGARAAVRCLATACDILSSECDPSSSRLFEFQKDFLTKIVDEAATSLNELKHDRERLAANCFNTSSEISEAKTKAHGSAEKTIHDFALLQYRLKTRLAEEQKIYQDTVNEEKAAMKKAVEALENLERAGRNRVAAAETLKKACGALIEEKDAFAASLTTHRGEEQEQTEKERVASALLQAVNVPCETLVVDAERVAKEAESDVKSLVRSSWMKLHQEHAECHRHLMKNAGDLFFRHRASIQSRSSSSSNKDDVANKTNKINIPDNELAEMKNIENEVQHADENFKRVSLPAIQTAGIEWIDPEEEIRLQLEQKAKTVMKGIVAKNEEGGPLLLTNK